MRTTETFISVFSTATVQWWLTNLSHPDSFTQVAVQVNFLYRPWQWHHLLNHKMISFCHSASPLRRHIAVAGEQAAFIKFKQAICDTLVQFKDFGESHFWMFVRGRLTGRKKKWKRASGWDYKDYYCFLIFSSFRQHSRLKTLLTDITV